MLLFGNYIHRKKNENLMLTNEMKWPKCIINHQASFNWVVTCDIVILKYGIIDVLKFTLRKSVILIN